MKQLNTAEQMMSDSLAVPAEASRVHSSAWDARISQVAALATRLCQEKDAVRSAYCSISGSPNELIVNLACTATGEEHVPMIMLYVNDTLLPQMESSLGIQFEVRNLQFAVAGREIHAPATVGLKGCSPTMDWLDQPLTEPIPATSKDPRGAHADLTLI
ncbi:hypothetical protein [Glutamicibacter sp. NPDC087673]|uniref:hypothetical protein n=1 Tax=Glutamicibacter sp. NPDC087673 TaxID=3363997 RepID=UPI00380DBC56